MAAKAPETYVHKCHFCAKNYMQGEPGYLTDKEAKQAKHGFAGYGNCGQHPESAEHVGIVIHKDFINTGEVVWMLPENAQKALGMNAPYAAGVAIHVGKDFILGKKEAITKLPFIAKRYK